MSHNIRDFGKLYLDPLMADRFQAACSGNRTTVLVHLPRVPTSQALISVHYLQQLNNDAIGISNIPGFARI
jgi:hypothetical protein